jgi:hypothetical protein
MYLFVHFGLREPKVPPSVIFTKLLDGDFKRPKHDAGELNKIWLRFTAVFTLPVYVAIYKLR